MFTAVLSMIFVIGNPYHLLDHVTITHDGDEIEEVDREDYTIPLFEDAFVADGKYNLLEERINKAVTKEPKNAWINEYGKIVPGVSGKQLDTIQFKNQFYTIFYQGSRAQLEVPIKNKYPRVDSELLEMIRSKQIGRYVTYFNKNNDERSTNIELSAEAINNHVVFPNEVFSFNEVVGKRTTEKGYLPAPVIVKGELAEDVGGGICQVSSTLYNAIDKAGLSVLERYSHSKQVPYVPPGRDATVSWYGPDFSFQNNYNQPILIRAEIEGGQVIISIFSSDQVEPDKNNVPEASKHLPEEIQVETVE